MTARGLIVSISSIMEIDIIILEMLEQGSTFNRFIICGIWASMAAQCSKIENSFRPYPSSAGFLSRYTANVSHIQSYPMVILCPKPSIKSNANARF